MDVVMVELETGAAAGAAETEPMMAANDNERGPMRPLRLVSGE